MRIREDTWRDSRPVTVSRPGVLAEAVVEVVRDVRTRLLSLHLQLKSTFFHFLSISFLAPPLQCEVHTSVSLSIHPPSSRACPPSFPCPTPRQRSIAHSLWSIQWRRNPDWKKVSICIRDAEISPRQQMSPAFSICSPLPPFDSAWSEQRFSELVSNILPSSFKSLIIILTRERRCGVEAYGSWSLLSRRKVIKFTREPALTEWS